ncbi:MAG: AAA family ATPase [Candidatus Omnitrophica bacterium]|nr:AAA family ATPase [Candidatus Omnitrophota bacterium]
MTNTFCFGLSTLPSSQNLAVKAKIFSILQSSNVLCVPSNENEAIALEADARIKEYCSIGMEILHNKPAKYAKELLKFNGDRALLLASGKRMVASDVVKDDISFLRALLHEDVEAVLQLLAVKDPAKFEKIKKTVLAEFKKPSIDLTDELYVNHVLALAFEWLILLKEGMLTRDDIPAKEFKHAEKIEKLFSLEMTVLGLSSFNNRDAIGDKYFGPEIWNSEMRRNVINDALVSGNRFFRVAGAFNSDVAEEAPEQVAAIQQDELKINRDKIPPKTIEYYAPTTKRLMKRIAKDLIMKKNVLLVGERGTGKNSVIYEMAHRINQPIEILSMNEETTVRDLTERMVLINGETKWVPSVLVEAMKQGRWLILDEIDRAPRGVLSVLNNLLQFKEMTLPDGTRLKAHENFRVIALMNPPTGAYAGSELSSELEDRFLMHYVDYLPEEEEVEYLKSIAPKVETDLIVRLVRAANDLRAAYKRGEIPKPFSTRGLVNVVEHLNEYTNDSVYAELYRVFNLRYISEEYQETVNKVFKTYDLMRANIEISPWENIGTENIEEENITEEEVGIFDKKMPVGENPESGIIEETTFNPENDNFEITEEQIKKIDEREFLVSELENTLKGHTNSPLALALTPDGDIVSGSSDNTIRIWDIKSGKVKILKGHTHQVSSLAITTDGKIISGSNDKTIRIWDIEKGKVKILKGQTEEVVCMALTLDGKIISGSNDKTIRIWDIESGKGKILKGHKSEVQSINLTSEGKIVSGSWDETIRIWDIESGKVKILKGHKSGVKSLALTSDGKIVSASSDKTIRIWDIESGKVKILKGHTETVSSLSSTIDGKIISGSWDETIRIWDIEKWKVKIIKDNSGWIRAIALTPDGKMLSGSDGRGIRIWDINEDRLNTLALKLMLEGDISEVNITDDELNNMLNIDGISLPKGLIPSYGIMSMATNYSVMGGNENEPFVIGINILNNLARILSHQPIEMEEWKPICQEDILNPRPTWRVFKRGEIHVIQYIKNDLREKDEDVPLAITGHEIFHLLYTDQDAWSKAIDNVEEKDLKGAFTWLINAHEDPRVNDNGVRRLPGLKIPLNKLYNKFYPTKFDNINEARINFNRNNPIHIQFGLMVVHDWMYGELHPLVTDKVLLEAYSELREKCQEIVHATTTGDMASIVYRDIWPEVKKLVTRSEEQMKNDEMLKKMIDNMEIDFDTDENKKGKDTDGRPIPIEMMPEEIKDSIKVKIQKKWDSLTDSEKEKIREKIRKKMRLAEETNNEALGPKIDAERGEMEGLKKVFEEKEGIREKIEDARNGSGPAAGSGAGIGHEDYLKREGVSEEDYQFYQKYYNEVSGQAKTLKNNLRKIKMEEKKKRVRRLREEGFIDENELPGVIAGEYRVFKDIQRSNKMFFKISFVVDMSGSMHSGNRIEEAMKGLIVLLESMQDWPEDILFEVVGFSNTECIPIREYSSKKITLKDKVQIIKDVHTLGRGGTNAAEAVKSAVERNVKGDKKYRRIVFLLTDGELLGGDAAVIGEAQRGNLAVKIVPMGLGETSQAVADIPNGRWLPEDGQLPNEIYKIMDIEFRTKANGKHGFTSQKTEWGNKMLASQFVEDMAGHEGVREKTSPQNEAQAFVTGVTGGAAEVDLKNISFPAGYAVDIDLAKVYIIYSALEEEQEYIIRFDGSRISKEQEQIIREYSKLIGSNLNLTIKVLGCDNSKALNNPLLGVYRQNKKGDVLGKGTIDVKLESGKVNEYFLRIVGMLNIAFSVSALPEDVEQNELLSKYKMSVAIMAEQYKMISNRNLINDLLSGRIKDIHSLMLVLPESDKILNKLTLYNKLVLEALVKA